MIHAKIRTLCRRRNSSGRHPHFRSPSFAFVLLVVGSLYATACTLPAFVTSGGGERFNFGAAYSGLKCLMLGWLIPQHWIANIFLLMGLLLLGSLVGRLAALAFGVLAIFASASMMIVFRGPWTFQLATISGHRACSFLPSAHFSFFW